MGLCVTLKGLYKPYDNVTKNFNKSATFHARELFPELSEQHLDELFPQGDKIRIDFTGKNTVAIIAEDRLSVLLDNAPMLVNQEHPLSPGDVKVLDLGKGIFHIKALNSDPLS